MFSLIGQFFKGIALPAVIVLLVVNLFVPTPKLTDPKQVIDDALAADNPHAAKAEYKKLIATDPLNIRYHRGYILAHFRIPEKIGRHITRDDEELRREYGALCADVDSGVSDVGHYGLGLIFSSLDDFKSSEEQFLAVRNQNLPYFNNSLGYVYLQEHRYDAAARCFRRELNDGGNVSGAYENLARVLGRQRDYRSILELSTSQVARSAIPTDVLRVAYLHERRWVEYGKLCANLEPISFGGILASLAIAAIWLRYLHLADAF